MSLNSLLDQLRQVLDDTNVEDLNLDDDRVEQPWDTARRILEKSIAFSASCLKSEVKYDDFTRTVVISDCFEQDNSVATAQLERVFQYVQKQKLPLGKFKMDARIYYPLHGFQHERSLNSLTSLDIVGRNDLEEGTVSLRGSCINFNPAKLTAELLTRTIAELNPRRVNVSMVRNQVDQWLQKQRFWKKFIIRQMLKRGKSGIAVALAKSMNLPDDERVRTGLSVKYFQSFVESVGREVISGAYSPYSSHVRWIEWAFWTRKMVLSTLQGIVRLMLENGFTHNNFEIIGRMECDAAIARRMSLPVRCNLSSIEVEDHSHYIGKPTLNHALVGVDDEETWFSIMFSIDKPALLNLQQFLCDDFGIDIT